LSSPYYSLLYLIFYGKKDYKNTKAQVVKKGCLTMNNLEITKEVVLEQLKGIITKTLELESVEQIKSDNLVEDLQLNSIDAMEILVWIENEYEIIFDDDEINVELMSSLNGLVAKVISKVSCK